MRSVTSYVAAVAAAVLSTHAAAFSAFYTFGDSLSDNGNNALVFDQIAGGARTPLPVPTNGFVPTLPYASSALTPGVVLDRYSNGFVWTELFAQATGLLGGARPSLALSGNFAGGANFAYGGAVTGGNAPFPLSLTNQVNTYLAGTGGLADANALYVVAGGGNNARAAAEAIRNGADLNTTIATFALQYAADTAGMVRSLTQAGAQSIVVWNVPNLGLAPAFAGPAGGLGTLIAASMNQVMQQAVWTQPNVIGFDLFGLLNNVAANPAQFGLTNISTACASLAVGCNPASFLFWDGIHPTFAGHRIIASAMVRATPEPTTLLLLAIAGIVLLLIRRIGR